MPKLADYVDLSDEAFPQVVERFVVPYVEGAAALIRDEIVAVMEESQPSGREYKVPGTETMYTASAPGEPPAIREGVYRSSWAFTRARRVAGGVASGVYNTRKVGEGEDFALWAILEYGATMSLGAQATVRAVVILPRPHILRGVERAVPKIKALAGRLPGAA